MKQLLTVIVLLLYASSVSGMQLFAGRPPAAGGGSGCTGSVTLEWNCENSADVTDSGNGCSVGDEVGAETDVAYESSSPTAQEGTYSVNFTTTTTSAVVFDVSSRDIVTEVAGTLSGYLWIDSWAEKDVIKVTSASNDFIRLRTYTGAGPSRQLEFEYRGNGTGVILQTDACDMSESEWVAFTMKWRQGSTDPSLYLYCSSGGGTDTETSNTDLTSWAGSPATVTFGQSAGNNISGNLDDLQIDNTYL
jgi:hypothetical protein